MKNPNSYRDRKIAVGDQRYGEWTNYEGSQAGSLLYTPKTNTTPDFSVTENQFDVESSRRPPELQIRRWQNFVANPSFSTDGGKNGD